MAVASDFIHDEEVVDAIIDVLEANLASDWLDHENPIWGLKRIEFGDLMQYRFSGDEGDRDIMDILPCILVSMGASTDAAAIVGAIGGKTGREATVTVLHVFGPQQCIDETATSPSERIQPARAKAQRIAKISEAIFQDWRTGSPTISTNDTSARIVKATAGAINYNPPGNAPDLYAVALDIDVLTHTH